MSMKKHTTFCAAALLTLFMLLPAADVLASIAGYELTLFSYPICAGMLLAAAACLSIPLFKAGKKTGTAARVMLCALPFSALVSMAAYIESGYGSEPLWNFLILLIMAACFGLSVFLVVFCCRKNAVKLPCCLATGVPALVLAFIGLIGVFAAGFGEDTVVETKESPDGSLIAELIDDDQGALGGNTLVYVRRNSGCDLGVVRLRAKAHEVYCGRWGEFYDMALEWKDSETLWINGKEYKVN